MPPTPGDIGEKKIDPGKTITLTQKVLSLELYVVSKVYSARYWLCIHTLRILQESDNFTLLG